MTDAREVLAMRNRLNLQLDPGALRDIHWPSITAAGREAIERGWTGEEVARMALGELGRGARAPGALLLSAIRALAQTAPPRESTAAPDNATGLHHAHAAALAEVAHVDHHAHAAAVKAQIHRRIPAKEAQP